MFCAHCGKEIPDIAAFCPYCGTAVASFGDDKSEPANEPVMDVSQRVKEDGNSFHSDNAFDSSEFDRFMTRQEELETLYQIKDVMQEYESTRKAADQYEEEAKALSHWWCGKAGYPTACYHAKNPFVMFGLIADIVLLLLTYVLLFSFEKPTTLVRYLAVVLIGFYVIYYYSYIGSLKKKASVCRAKQDKIITEKGDLLDHLPDDMQDLSKVDYLIHTLEDNLAPSLQEAIKRARMR